MTMTSGWCSSTASTAFCPSETAPTTSMSSCSPSSSSSASENTWLSSTSRTRIGTAATARRLFRRQEEWVVRLAAPLDVDLEIRMQLPQPGEQRVELRLLLAGQERQDPARLGEQALGHCGRDLVEVRAGGDGRAVREAEVLAGADRETVQLCVARRRRDLSRGDRRQHLQHLG